MAATLSAVLPGLGQLVNGEMRLGLLLMAPVLMAIGLVLVALQLTSLGTILGSLLSPGAVVSLLALNVLLLLLRVAAVGQAFLGRPHRAAPTRAGWTGLVVIVAFVVVPHGLANTIGGAVSRNLSRVIESPGVAASGPGTTERLNVLLIGVDAAPGRTAVLTDSLMVVSLDPVGETVSMLSIPRDTVNVPLPGGGTFAPKINSLYGHAERNRDDFPQGPLLAVRGAVGTLLGIEIHHHVVASWTGLIRLVDAVGGVDVDVPRTMGDPNYDGFGLNRRGWSIEAGRHHLDGVNALAYARLRRSPGESDFTRNERQQQVLLAIRDRAVRGETLLLRLPQLLDAVGDTIRTDLPPDLFPVLADAAEKIDRAAITRIVVRHPLVSPGSTQYGSVQIPDVTAIRAVAALAFSPPGTPPAPWPTPTPGPASSGPPPASGAPRPSP